MGSVVVVGVVDPRGWLLLQERDDRAPVDPDKWSLIGGGVDEGESPVAAARRELAEETGVLRDDLRHLGHVALPCEVHGTDEVDLFAVHADLDDADIACNEGRQMVFVRPELVADLDLTDMTRALFERVLTA